MSVIKICKPFNMSDVLKALPKPPRGAGCSKNGAIYERKVHEVVSKCVWRDTFQPFNIQDSRHLGGSSSKHDLICNKDELCIPIEVKKHKAPDWGQLSLSFDKHNERP